MKNEISIEEYLLDCSMVLNVKVSAFDEVNSKERFQEEKEITQNSIDSEDEIQYDNSDNDSYEDESSDDEDDDDEDDDDDDNKSNDDDDESNDDEDDNVNNNSVMDMEVLNDSICNHSNDLQQENNKSANINLSDMEVDIDSIDMELANIVPSIVDSTIMPIVLTQLPADQSKKIYVNEDTQHQSEKCCQCGQCGSYFDYKYLKELEELSKCTDDGKCLFTRNKYKICVLQLKMIIETEENAGWLDGKCVNYGMAEVYEKLAEEQKNCVYLYDDCVYYYDRFINSPKQKEKSKKSKTELKDKKYIYMPVYAHNHYSLVCIVLSDFFLTGKYGGKSNSKIQKNDSPHPVAYVMVFDSLEKKNHVKEEIFVSNIYR
jgi:hypothetical protein